MERPQRKPNRLNEYDYSQPGYYFITVCTKNRECLFGTVVGDGVLDVPYVELSQYGVVVNNRIIEMNSIYDDLFIDKYVIMPNHLHLIILISGRKSDENGTSRTPSRTNQTIPMFVSTLKRLTNKEIGFNLWHRSYHDHIIRNEADYLRIWQYIDNNPSKWAEDKYYVGDDAHIVP